MLAKIPNKETETVVNALIKQARKLPDELYKSLTWDRGKELADHRRFTMETDIAVFFLRSAKPLAARLKRKHQQAVAPVFSKEDRFGAAFAGLPQQNRAPPQRTTAGNAGLP